MSKKVFGTVLILIIVMACGFSSFAEPKVDLPNGSDTNLVIENNDTTIEYDDMGIYEMIKNIEDPIKKEKIIEYWYAPAFYTFSAIDMRNQMALIEGVQTVKYLVGMPTENLDSAINGLLQKDIDRFLNDQSVKILPSFIEYIKDRPLENVSELSQKVGLETGVILNLEEQGDVLTGAYEIQSIATTTTTANYTQGNPGQLAYLTINCSVVWKRDTVTDDITSLVPSTTTGYYLPYFVGSGYEISDQWIAQGYPDKGYVQKSKMVFNYVTGSSVHSGYLLSDIVVKGNGIVSKKYAAYPTPIIYSFYQWGD